MTWIEDPRFYQLPAEIDKVPEIPLRAAAVALVNPEKKILLMKRVDYGSGHGSDWVYPGGAVDPGESLDQTARREILEEAGIVLDQEKNRLFPLANYNYEEKKRIIRHHRRNCCCQNT